MRLFHYTIPGNALLLGSGHVALTPGLGKDDKYKWQTFGVPVVWLTRQETNIATEADVAHVARFCEPEHHVKVGEPMFGGPVRCIVEIERSKHLVRYTDFLRTTDLVAADLVTGDEETGRDLLRLCEHTLPPSALTSWWVCTREIPASKIYVPLTKEQAIEACESRMEGSESFRQQRDAFAGEPDSTVFILHNGECQIVKLSDAA